MTPTIYFIILLMAFIFLILHLIIKTKNPLFAIISGVLFLILGGISLLGQLSEVTGTTANATWEGNNITITSTIIETPVSGLTSSLGIIGILASVGILASAWIENKK